MARCLIAVMAASLISLPSLGNAAAADKAELLEACYKAVNAGSFGAACELCAAAVKQNSGAARDAARINLARCEEGKGRLGRALALYREVRAGLPEDDERAAGIDARIAELEGKMAELTLDWSKAEGASLLIDGEAIEGRPSSIAIDPGERAFEVTLAGREPRRDILVITEGGTSRYAVIPTLLPPDHGMHPQAIAGLIVGSVGLLGLAGFAVTGGLILDRQATVDAICPENDSGVRICSAATGIEAADEGKVLNVVNAVALGVGIAGLATGLGLFLSAPDSAEASAEVSLELGPGAAAIRIRGSF